LRASRIVDLRQYRGNDVVFGMHTAPGSAVTAPDTAHTQESVMLYWSAIFFVIALVAALLGFGGLAHGAADIGKVLFFLFIVLFIISVLVGLFTRGRGV
jgi:uncharacterized membrane protein YtjA (UPF0391 family)